MERGRYKGQFERIPDQEGSALEGGNGSDGLRKMARKNLRRLIAELSFQWFSKVRCGAMDDKLLGMLLDGKLANSPATKCPCAGFRCGTGPLANLCRRRCIVVSKELNM